MDQSDDLAQPVDSSAAYPKWAQQLLEQVGIEQQDSAEEKMQKIGTLADKLAPNTRKMWNWILALQGVAIITPLLWLLILRVSVHTRSAAIAGLLGVAALLFISWWLRWRNTQNSWVSSRFVTEILRSIISTQHIDPDITPSALRGKSEAYAIAKRLAQTCPSVKKADISEERYEEYREKRINDQLSYYREKLNEAWRIRRKLSRNVTLAMDAALFLAIGGIVIAFTREEPESRLLLALSGTDIILAAVGAFLPLLAILLQLLGSYLELNRRTGKYAQQVDFLEETNKTYNNGSVSRLETIKEVESELLSEILEWYYQSKYSEPYYRSISAKNTPKSNVKLPSSAITFTILDKCTNWLGVGASFVGRVIFGRVLVAALSVVFTISLIAFLAPKHHTELSVIRSTDGKLLSSPLADGWSPNPLNTHNGFLLIAHGLHDGVDTTPDTSKKVHWMTKMQNGIKQRLGADCPDICLVDWHEAAIPSQSSGIGFEKNRISVRNEKGELDISLPSFIQGVTAIRPTGEIIGETVGYKLARAIRRKEIDKDRPFHLIGHSAGGFVVIECAIALKELGLLPENTRITLLDTPFPVTARIELLAGTPIDFYRTSNLAGNIPDDKKYVNYRFYDLIKLKVVPRHISGLKAHSYAHQWYIQTIVDPKSHDKGFSFSPFAETKKTEKETN